MDKKLNKCIQCGKGISENANRCSSCAKIGKFNPFYGKHHSRKICKILSEKHKNIYNGIKNPNYIDGRTLKTYYCKDCGKRIDIKSGFYGQGRCNSCARRGKYNSLWKGGISFKKYYKDKLQIMYI